MKKFEISANFIGQLFAVVEASTAEEAKMKFLTSLGCTVNEFGDWSVSIDDVLIPSAKPVMLAELNMAFSKNITDDDKKYWNGIEVEEADDTNALDEEWNKN